jgi:hypothetical protein
MAVPTSLHAGGMSRRPMVPGLTSTTTMLLEARCARPDAIHGSDFDATIAPSWRRTVKTAYQPER